MVAHRCRNLVTARCRHPHRSLGVPTERIKRPRDHLKTSIKANGSASPVNRLLDALPTRDRRRMLAKFDSVELRIADVLYNLEERLYRVYFPLNGFIALIMPIHDTALAIGLIGSEGMFGIMFALGVDRSPVRAVVRVRDPRYASVPRRFAAYSHAVGRCNEIGCYPVRPCEPARTDGWLHGFHVIEARLARWLLMTQDRALGEHLPYYPGILGRDARRSPRRHHEGCKLATEAQSDSLHAGPSVCDSAHTPSATSRIGQSE